MCRHKHTTSLSENIVDLLPNTSYKYRLQATDKTDYYENITAYSNEVEVLTKPSSAPLTVRFSSHTGYQVEVEHYNPDYRLYVYSVQG